MTDEFVRDAESRKRIEERSKKSTVAIHSSGPYAKILLSGEWEPKERLDCPYCGWTGLAEEGEFDTFREVWDVSCPKCLGMLLVISYLNVE